MEDSLFSTGNAHMDEGKKNFYCIKPLKFGDLFVTAVNITLTKICIIVNNLPTFNRKCIILTN